jgi:hypothetical protein
MLPLSVQDSHGVPIAQTVPGHVVRLCYPCGYQLPELPPGGTLTVGWTEFGTFGYALTRPGGYAITASLHGQAFTRTSYATESIGMNGEDKSNPVYVQILP